MIEQGRLAAPPASRGCLDLAAVHRIEQDCGAESLTACTRSLLPFIKQAMQDADSTLAERFWAGEDVVELVRSRAWAAEQLILLAWRVLWRSAEPACLVAVGGFGRGELHPHSDIDLMILLDTEQTDGETAAVLEGFVQLLWDAGFYLGHSIRTLRQCTEESLADVVTLTTLMEARLMDGPAELFEGLAEALKPPGVWPAYEFYRAKIEEQAERHARFHDTAYNLEPNVKEGPGGLRDIQMIGWVSQRHFGTRTLHGLVDNGLLTEPEYQDLRKDLRLLWRIRFALHLLAGRAEDRLLFEYQREIAVRFGFEDREENLAVEQFMQSYYRTVMQLERLNERTLQLFREAFLAGSREDDRTISPAFRIHHGYLEITDETVFLARPAALMELFVVLARDQDIQGVTARAIRTIRDHLFLIDERFRADPEVNALFLELLRQPEGVYSQLQRMNRYGLLAAYIPAFGKIVGRMQYDLFHVYTVDQHTLFVVRNLRRFAYGKYREHFPHCQQVFRRIVKPELLYLAALFHDIAKGRGGDHSELGAVDAEEFCARLDLGEAEKKMVAWLVRYHLLMSQTAQRKDLSDPANIHAFAETVGSTRYLDHLYLLTVADIAGTSPKLWNSWKNKLLWELYRSAGDALRRGLDHPLKRATRMRETRAAALSRLLRRGFDSDAISELWTTLPEYAFWRLSPDQLEWATDSVLAKPGEGTRIAVRGVQPHGVSELFVCVPDRAGLFASIVRVLDEMNLNVVSARVLTTLDDRSFDLFQIMDRHERPVSEQDCAELVARLQAATAAADEPGGPVRRAVPRRLRQFESSPTIEFAADPDGGGTVLHLHCNDRPGLLSRVAAALFEQGAQVHNARIATFGERVEDTFLISGRHRGPLSEPEQAELRSALLTQLE